MPGLSLSSAMGLGLSARTGGGTPTPAPVTTSFAYSAFGAGFTLLHDDISTPTQAHFPGNTNQLYASVWCGLITGTAATLRMASLFPGSQLPSIDVSVDGGAFATFTTGPETDYYTLFTGLTDTAHFVVFRRTPAPTNQFIYIPIGAASMKVTGVAPAIAPAAEWLLPGDGSSKSVSTSGVIATPSTIGFNQYMGASRFPTARPAWDSGGATKTNRMGALPVLTIRTSSTELWVVCQGRYVNILIGGVLTSFDTTAASAIGSGAVRVARITGLAAGDKTIHVFPSGTNTTPVGQWLAVGVPPGQSFGTVSGFNKAHTWGDSISQGVAVTGFTVDQMVGLTDVPRAFTAQGFTPGLFGVAGAAFSDYQAGATQDIAVQLTYVTAGASDVAYVALGENGTPTAPEVTYVANQYIAKGYGKVIFRGVLPKADNGHLAKNVTISGALTAIGDAKLRYIDPNAWTELSGVTALRPDGIHFSPSGYDALLARMNVALPVALA